MAVDDVDWLGCGFVEIRIKRVKSLLIPPIRVNLPDPLIGFDATFFPRVSKCAMKQK